MRKIPTIFLRDHATGLVTTTSNPAAAWVFAGQGHATRKYDGMCVKWTGDAWLVRRVVKAGRTAPSGFVPVQEDPVTGHVHGWEPAEQSGFRAVLLRAAQGVALDALPDTFELCGPSVNGNPERYAYHVLVRHSTATRLPDAPRDHAALRAYLHALPYEGIVWHGPNNQRAKAKKRDFPAPDAQDRG